jgi:pimeloyl-ACP methyl ester carboxylesterase
MKKTYSVEVSNGTVNVEMRGKGIPVLWLHGFCEDCSFFDTLIEKFIPGFLHITLDFPGYGKSLASKDFSFSMHDMATAVEQCLEKLNISRVHVIGHSMGGYVALKLQELRPEKIFSIVLLHSTADADSQVKKDNRNRTIEVVRNNKALFLREFHLNLFHQPNRLRLQNEIHTIQEKATQVLSSETIIQTLKGLRDRPSHLKRLQKSNVALHYIIGKHDPILPAEELVNQTSLLNATVDILEETGHMGFLEEPEKCRKALEEFLTSLQ